MLTERKLKVGLKYPDDASGNACFKRVYDWINCCW